MSAFDIKITGDGQSPVPLQITIGPRVLTLGLAALAVWLLAGTTKAKSKRRGNG